MGSGPDNDLSDLGIVALGLGLGLLNHGPLNIGDISKQHIGMIY